MSIRHPVFTMILSAASLLTAAAAQQAPDESKQHPASALQNAERLPQSAQEQAREAAIYEQREPLLRGGTRTFTNRKASADFSIIASAEERPLNAFDFIMNAGEQSLDWGGLDQPFYVRRIADAEARAAEGRRDSALQTGRSSVVAADDDASEGQNP